MYLIEFMLLGIIAGMVGLFYNYTLQNNAILGKIGAKLEYWVNFYDYIQEDFKPTLIDRFKAWIANPLGACLYCSTTWITILLLILYFSSFDKLPKWELVAIYSLEAIGVQHLFLRIICCIEEESNKNNR